MDARDRGVGLSGCTKAGKGLGDRVGRGGDNGDAVGLRQGCMRVGSK